MFLSKNTIGAKKKVIVGYWKQNIFSVAKTFRDEDKATPLKQKYFCCKFVFATKFIFWQQNNFVANSHISYNGPKAQN